MSANLESLIHSGYDLIFPCLICQEKNIYQEADFFCKECSKCYCGTCGEYHNFLFKNHAILGKENISQWPETNVDVQEQCQEHKGEKLTAFCEDHGELMCHVCHIYTHKKCSVVLMADSVKDLNQKGEFKQMSATIDTLHGQLIQNKDDFEERLKSLEKSYNTILKQINDLRREINYSLDQLEKNTIKELSTLLAKMKSTIQTDIAKCTNSIKNMTHVSKDWHNVKYKSEAGQFIKYRQCLGQSAKIKEVLQEMTTKNDMTLTFTPNTIILQTLRTLSGLGEMFSQVKHSQTSESIEQNTETRQDISDTRNRVSSQELHQTSDLNKPADTYDPIQVITVKSSIKYSMSLIGKKEPHCSISGICEAGDGELFITDYWNKRVKLLDSTYRVVFYCDLPSPPMSICSIDSSLVAVALSCSAVLFFKKTIGPPSNTNQQWVQDTSKTQQLKHSCLGIAQHHGNLYITSGTALYQYTADGRLVGKMYEYTSYGRTDMIGSCAISPDGERIYLATSTSNQLITLARDGTVLSRVALPAMKSELITFLPGQDVFPGLHVTDLGQVLVCGLYSHKIIQVDRDGKQMLSEVVTENNDVIRPTSVYYSAPTQSLVVSMLDSDHILVFSTERQEESADDVKMAHMPPYEEVRCLLQKIKVDAIAECPTDSFPAFCHGLAAIQAIITRGRDILELPVFTETENKMMQSECIQIYTTSALMDEINKSNPEQLNPLKHACPEELNISFPVIVIVKLDTKTVIEEWIKTQHEHIVGVCVLLVTAEEVKEQQYFAPEKGMLLSMATISDIMVTADDILERSIFFVLRHLTEVYLEKYPPTTGLSDIETESTLQSVYAYARAAYQRSEVPECERPNIPKKTYTYPERIDEVIKTLLTIEGVVGCSKKLGRLEVSIDDTKGGETTVDRVKLQLKNEPIEVTFVHGQFTYLFCPGDQVKGNRGKMGTLGGFAKRFATKNNIELNKRAETGKSSLSSFDESSGNLCAPTNTTVKIYKRTKKARESPSSPEESTENLVALISRHVAYANLDMGKMHLLVGNTTIGHTDNIHPQTLLDIIPIDIYKIYIEDCKTKFKTEKNKLKHGQLIDKELRSTLIGTKVYIWGAVSSPGLGTLDEIDFEMTEGLCIKVRDRINGEPFSDPGDSGAIVCGADSRGRNLYAIAMLIGKYESKNPPLYMAVLLNEAFEILNELYNSDFRLCEDDGTT